MLKRYKIYLICLCLFYVSLLSANERFTTLKEGMPYEEAKNALLAKGWQAVENKQIDHSSLYAAEIYNQGMTEVVDCISMELDACRFQFEKGAEVLVIKTITRRLTFDSFTIIKK